MSCHHVFGDTIVRLKIHELSLHRPRPWGGRWLACHLYQTLGLDAGYESRKLTRELKGRHGWQLKTPHAGNAL